MEIEEFKKEICKYFEDDKDVRNICFLQQVNNTFSNNLMKQKLENFFWDWTFYKNTVFVDFIKTK